MPIQALAFDIDGTLTESKSRLSHPVAIRLCDFLEKYPIALVTGGTIKQIKEQIVEILADFHANLSNLHLFPLSGAEYYRWNGCWRVAYRQEIPLASRQHIATTIEQTAKELGLWIEHTWGDVIEDRLCQVTFSAWGQEAPIEIKRNWDENGEKKRRLQERLQDKLPQYSVRVGGTTSVDVSLPDIDKSLAITHFSTILNIDRRHILFLGDQLQKGGNDYPILSTGVCCIQVLSIDNTIRILDTII